MNSLIELDAISKSYRMANETVPVLKNLTLRVPKGDYLTIMGPSGSGKSTLMQILGCLDVPTSGAYYFDNQDLTTLSDSQLTPIRRHKIGFVFQSFNLIPTLSALDNVALPLMYLHVPKSEQREKAREALSRVGLKDRLHHRPSQLSGGQQQRVAIARAIVSHPQLILADEPTGNLDTHTGKAVLDIFQELSHTGHTIIIITHDREVAQHGKHTVEIRDGVFVGSSEVPK